MRISQLSLLFHTVRHLRLRQIIYRLYYRFGRSFVSRKALSPIRDSFVRRWESPWHAPSYATQSYFGDGEFRFLGESGRATSPSCWNDASRTKLWLYNLHYFDDLNAERAESRRAQHEDLIDRWIAENPPVTGNGWEPYPLSLRLVNWVKWFAGVGSSCLTPERLSSACRQAQALSAQVEHHIMANHIFANGKALVFSGAFFGGENAGRWLRQGLRILDREVPEQFLADGGHFERSPMYHAILLWDLCDLVNLAERSGLRELGRCSPQWRERLKHGMVWLRAMTHPDGGIAFFNDATFGIAPTLEDLQEYTALVGERMSWASDSAQRLHHLKESGFVVVYLPDGGKAILDTGNIGPAYQPGHAHAETLSFELSLFGRRVFVNSGISCYGEDEERQRQRSTAAHTTLVVDGQNSSEVWRGFRVARRAKVRDLQVYETAKNLTAECSHDGYRRLPGKVIHKRRWVFTTRHIEITDTLSGVYSDARVFFYLHPDVHVEKISFDEFLFRLQRDEQIRVVFSGTKDVELKKSTWHPAFGTRVLNMKICAALDIKRSKIITKIDW